MNYSIWARLIFILDLWPHDEDALCESKQYEMWAPETHGLHTTSVYATLGGEGILAHPDDLQQKQ